MAPLSFFLPHAPFKQQLSVAVTVGLFCFALFSSLLTSWQGSRQIRATLLTQGQHIAENLASQSALALLYGSADNAREVVATTLSFPDVTRVEIRHTDGRPLIVRGTPETGPGEDLAVPWRQPDSHEPFLEQETQESWRFVAPVLRQANDSPFEIAAAREELIGFVRVVQSKDTLTRMLADAFLINLAVSFLFAFAFLFVIHLLAERLARPITALSAAMARAEHGEAGVRATIGGPQDIRDMAHAFNSMIEALEEREQALRESKLRYREAADTVTALNAELEDRVHQRTAELEAANRELESFAYSVSHDLRAPLRAIDGFSRILQEDYGASLDGEGRRLLGVVRGNTERMGQLIDDILAFSRMGRHPIAATTIDMTRLAREVFGELAAAAPDRNIQFALATLPPGRGDRALLRQVLVNLLANAIKFTQPRQPAQIEVGGSSEAGENVYYVKDNGVGFDMQYAGKLFGVFERLHPASEFEGTGIGLAIVKRIVNRHGGRVWAEAEAGRGATLHFTLPAAEIAAPVVAV